MRWLAFVAGLLLVNPVAAQSLNIVTAIDVSESIDDTDFALEMEGLARGVMDDRFVAQLGEGVGFEVFTWASEGVFDTIVPYTVLRDGEDAAVVAVLLRSQDFASVRRYPSALDQYQSGRVGMTDLSAAIDEAGRRLLLRPAKRQVINVLSDGQDNIGAGPAPSRNLAEALGVTVNAVIFGEGVSHEDYYHAEVITGPGAFVLVAETPADLLDALERKFWQDMVAGAF